MQKLFKRSLAMVLALMMVLTMFAVSASAEEAYTKYAGTNDAMFHIASVGAADLNAPNALDMQYLAQEFVPDTNTINGVKLNINLTSGSVVMHVELRKGSATAEPFFGTDVTLNSVGDSQTSFYTLNFGEDVAVEAGAVYYLAFWMKSKSSDGIVVIAQGGASEGHDVYRHKRFSSDGEKFEPETAPFKATGNAMGFEILSSEYAKPTVIPFFDGDNLPHHAADRGKWEPTTQSYTQGQGAYRSLVDFRSGDKLSHARLFTDSLVDITPLYNENGEFYLTFDMYVDPEYVTSAKNYVNEGNAYNPEEVPTIKEGGLDASRFLILMYSKGANQTATDPKSGKQAIEVTKWENSHANYNESTSWAMFGLEDGLKGGWNHMALKLTDKDGVLSYGKAGQEAYWDPTNMWGLSFLVRATNWTDPYDKHGTVDLFFDDIKFMSVSEYEANFESESKVKDTIAKIAEIKDGEDEAGIQAAASAYAALTDEQKAQVTNYPKLEGIYKVVDKSIYAVEGKNVGSGYILIPAGPQDNTPYPTTPTPWTQNYTEGTGAGKMQWLNTSNPTLHLSILGIDQTWDFSDVEYVSMDLYVHGWSVKKTGDTDFNFGYGEPRDAGNWGSQNKGWIGKDVAWEAGIKDLKEGWNHLIFPVPAGARINGIGNMRLFFEKSIVFNVEEGDKPYAIVDDIRAFNANALPIIKERNAAKDVITAIQEMDTVEEMKAIREAYNALNDVQKSYVFNLNVLEDMEKDALAGLAIDEAFAGLKDVVKVYHNADAVDNSIVNINSGSWNVAAENGAIKASAKNDVTKNAFCVGFRADAVKLNDYDTMTFDLFIPEGVTVPADTYGYAYFADKHVTNQDDRVWRYEIKAQALAAAKGEWVTYTVPVADQNFSGIVQVSIRLAVTTAANGYVLIDNIQFNKHYDTLTFVNKAGVDAVYAQYAALNEKAQSYATCGAELKALKADLDAKQVALDDANAKIAAVPAVDALVMLDKYTVDAAVAAYEALADDVKPFAVGADKLAPASEKVEALFAAATAEQLAEFITAAIETKLPSADEVTLADADLVDGVANTYDNAGEAKALVSKEAAAKLYAVRAVVAALKADAEQADAVNAAVAALPETLTLANKDAVYAARDIYDAMNDNAKAQVADVAALNAAIAAMDKLVADDAAVKAITEAVNALPEDATAEELKVVVDLYNAANAEVLAGLDKDVAAKCVAAKAEYVNLGAYEIQFRGFDKQKADYNCNMGGVFHNKDIPAVGTGYMGGKASAEQGELHHYIYAYNQNHDDAADGSNADGMVKFLVKDSTEVYVSFDFYVSDAAVIREATGDCGFGIDAESADPNVGIGTFQGWGSTWTCRRTTISPILKEIKDGWNHIVLPMSLVKNSYAELIDGTEVTLRTMRFYIVGIKAPAGFVSAIDDVRVMNKEAAEKIFPARTNAKVVTDMIRAYPAEGATDADFYNVYLAYNAVADEYKDLIVGWDAFAEANADKKAAAEEAMTADKAAAAPVVEAIAALDKAITADDEAAIVAAEKAYADLTDNQKVLVGNANILTAARAALDAALAEKADKDAAQAVIDAINALPETVSDTDVSNTDIAAAREAYDALTDAQKALVAEEIVAKLAAAEANLVIAIDMAAAAKVEAMIDALATPTDITVSDTDVVNAAAEAYGKLTAAQKEYLSAGVAEKLAACVEALDKALSVKMGDINGDDKVDAKDALAALKISVNKMEATDAQKAAADVNEDGEINAKDALEILKYSVNKESALDKFYK